MKRSLAILCLFALLTITMPVASQGPAVDAAGIYGRLDPRTGVFTPIHLVSAVAQDGSDVAPPTTTYTGKFVVNFTITISSSVPTADTIGCDVGIVVADATGDISEALATSATRSGSTATCTVTLPYSWAITSTTDVVTLSYDVSAPPQPLVSSSTFPRRYTKHPIASINVPANGATTTYTVTPTI